MPAMRRSGLRQQEAFVERNSVVTTYPLPVRLGMSVICALLLVTMLKGPMHILTIVVTILAICVDVGLLAYRAEIDATKVHVRYAPFCNKQALVSDVTHFVEERTLVLVTGNSRIPIWGLSSKARETLFSILPPHLTTQPEESSSKTDPVTNMKLHLRRTGYVGAGFVVVVASLVPFLNADPESSMRKCLVILCMGLFIATAFEGVMTYTYWSYLRNVRRATKRHEHKRS
jgi:hypothetical protein